MNPITEITDVGRVCTACLIPKIWDDFHKNPASITGHRARCKECENKAQRLVKPSQRLQHKLEVFSHYGGVCFCCGEDEILFLQIDHINDDGAAQRQELGDAGAGYHFYYWLRINGYPEGYRVSCANCNIGRHLNGGTCPHENNDIGV